MTVLSVEEAALTDMITQGGKLDVGIMDGMSVAAEESWRSGPTGAIVRAAKSVFDTSEELAPEDANKRFGLEGTPAAFTEPIKFDAAQSRANDFHDLRMNDMITETVNQESPVLGRATQFAASMAASMVDPTMIATNVVGAGIIGAGAKALTNSTRAFNFIAKSPSVGRALLSAYADDAVRSLGTVVAREGLENFASTVIEEGISMVGVGEDQMARKVSVGERMQNIVIGTAAGMGFGTLLSKDGRNAIAKGHLWDWGDDAPDFVHSNAVLSSLEANAGHEKGRLEIDVMNKERFGARPWYNESPTKFAPDAPLAKRIYVPINEDGSMHTFSRRGDGPVFTADKVHAMNSGVKVMEVNTNKLKIAMPEEFALNGSHTQLGKTVASSMTDTIVHGTDPLKLAQTLAIMKDPEVDLSAVTSGSFKENKAALKEMLNGKNLDEMMDIVNGVQKRSQTDLNVHSSVEDTLDKAGINGYSFAGKDFDGKPAYQGVYVSPKYTKRIQKAAVHDVPVASAGDKLRWNFEQEQVYKKHKDWVQKEAKPLKSAVDDIKEMVGQPKETPLDASAPKINDHHVEALAGTKEKVSVLTKAKDSLRAEMDKLKADGKDIDPDMEKSVAIMEAIEQGVDQKKMLETDLEGWNKFTECILGAFKGTV